MSLFPHQTRVSYFSFHRLVRSSVSTLQFQLYTSVFPLSNFSHQLPLSSSSFTPQSFRSPTFLISFHSPAVLYSLIFPFSNFIHQFSTLQLYSFSNPGICLIRFSDSTTLIIQQPTYFSTKYLLWFICKWAQLKSHQSDWLILKVISKSLIRTHFSSLFFR